MANTATPRDLDPKFKDATVPQDADQTDQAAVTQNESAKESGPENESPQETLKRLQSTEIPKDPTEGFILHRQRFVASDGTAGEKVHGPMPVSEWPAYSAKNGL
jgi:hypothetical protein